ncbi:uncharacterized protein M6B38_367800 [Iris pallida]|uniref:Uncharacterized protein n=1 Tax=Iris pallida TaxID=29817 RepID=A0AAX6GF66_IRIPA|nr:uncharacterized protein M6B38_367800 [Iris pallida]
MAELGRHRILKPMTAQQNRPVPVPGPSASTARRQRATTNSFPSR